VSDFQALSSAQGRLYERYVRDVLVVRGWTLHGDKPLRVPPVTVDVVATDPQGTLWWIECKGSYRNQPGCERSDTVLKAVAVAWALRTLYPERPPYLLITSRLPKPGSAPDAMLRAALAEGLFDRLEQL
jgi:hypothetical protein